jgi:hypothetical protein
MKVVAQNYKALAYLSAFLEPTTTQQFSRSLDEVNATWNPGERLSDEQLKLLLKMNRDLRRAYDASPARAFGMKAFDEEFKPLLGWDDHYSRYLQG